MSCWGKGGSRVRSVRQGGYRMGKNIASNQGDHKLRYIMLDSTWFPHCGNSDWESSGRWARLVQNLLVIDLLSISWILYFGIRMYHLK